LKTKIPTSRPSRQPIGPLKAQRKLVEILTSYRYFDVMLVISLLISIFATLIVLFKYSTRKVSENPEFYMLSDKNKHFIL
jgi:hypothetical protein